MFNIHKMSNQVFKNKDQIYTAVNPVQEYFRQERLTQMTSVSGLYEIYTQLDVITTGGAYLFIAKAAGENASAEELIPIRIQVDGVDLYVEITRAPASPSGNSSFIYQNIIDLSRGAHSITLAFETLNPPDAVRLDSAYLSLIKLSDI